MKSFRIILFSSLLTLFMFQSDLYGQSVSKEDLGRALVKSVVDRDLDQFRALLLPKKVYLETQEGTETTYDANVMPRYEKNFWEIVHLNEANQLNWNSPEFMVLYKYASNIPDYDPYLIRTKLNNSGYDHFYFSAVRYKGSWYLEDKMELTQGEKYAAKD